jgi:hypothetical protein
MAQNSLETLFHIIWAIVQMLLVLAFFLFFIVGFLGIAIVVAIACVLLIF